LPPAKEVTWFFISTLLFKTKTLSNRNYYYLNLFWKEMEYKYLKTKKTKTKTKNPPQNKTKNTNKKTSVEPEKSHSPFTSAEILLFLKIC